MADLRGLGLVKRCLSSGRGVCLRVAAFVFGSQCLSSARSLRCLSSGCGVCLWVKSI